MSWPFGVTMVKIFSCLLFAKATGIQEDKFLLPPYSVPVTCVTHYVLLYLKNKTVLFLK
jgi:hypothetical protein